MYLNYNKYKFYLVRLLNGLLYAITRFSYFPVLLSLVENINLISALCLVILFAYSFKAKRIFTEDIKLMSWCLSIITICHTIHKYLQAVFIDKYELEKNYYGGTNFWGRFMAMFDDGGNTAAGEVTEVKTLRILANGVVRVARLL